MTVDDAPVESPLAMASDTPELRRLHPLTPILRSWRLIAGAGAVGLSVFRDESDRLVWLWHALHGDVGFAVLLRGVGVVLAVTIVSLTAAWLSWRATGFAIVEDSNGRSTLLFHQGFFVKHKRQVRLDRVQAVDVNQPLIPRLCGLAAVRLDMAAGEEASANLAYLRASEAWLLREEILRHTGAGATHAVVQKQVVVNLVAEISTLHLIKANLLDGAWAWAIFVLWVVALVVTPLIWGAQIFVAALSGIVPVTIAILAALRVQITSILRDANFRLYRTATGIRVSSGLTSTVNRTIELDRIQGVRMVEPFLWRRLGWARVVVDIAGADDDGGGASLMPVATRGEALTLIADVTGVHLDSPAYAGPGARARRVDPLGWKYLGVALLPQGAVRREGRWRRSTSYVPFARVQSVTARQGVLQRRLDLATVHLDLPKGAARWSARHRSAADAADLVPLLARLALEHRLGELSPPQATSPQAGSPQAASPEGSREEAPSG